MLTSVELSCAHEQYLEVVSVYDARDPTAASPELRQRASSSVQSCFPEVSSSVRASDLDGLRIGIPQVVILHPFPGPLIPSHCNL